MPSKTMTANEKKKKKDRSTPAGMTSFSCNVDVDLQAEFNISQALRRIVRKQDAFAQAIRLWISTDPKVIAKTVGASNVMIAVPRQHANTIRAILNTLEETTGTAHGRRMSAISLVKDEGETGAGD